MPSEPADSGFMLLNPVRPDLPGPAALPFVTVFAPDGRTVRFSSTLGPDTANARRLVARNDDELFVALDTAADGLATPGAFQDVRAGGVDLR